MQDSDLGFTKKELINVTYVSFFKTTFHQITSRRMRLSFKGYYSIHESIFQINLWAQKFILCMTSSLTKIILLGSLVSSAFFNFLVKFLINDDSDVSLPTENLLFLIWKVYLSGYGSDLVCSILLSIFSVFLDETVELRIFSYKNLCKLL